MCRIARSSFLLRRRSSIGLTIRTRRKVPGGLGMKSGKPEKIGKFVFLEIGEAYDRKRCQEGRAGIDCTVVDGIPNL